MPRFDFGWHRLQIHGWLARGLLSQHAAENQMLHGHANGGHTDDRGGVEEGKGRAQAVVWECDAMR